MDSRSEKIEKELCQKIVNIIDSSGDIAYEHNFSKIHKLSIGLNSKSKERILDFVDGYQSSENIGSKNRHEVHCDIAVALGVHHHKDIMPVINTSIYKYFKSKTDVYVDDLTSIENLHLSLSGMVGFESSYHKKISNTFNLNNNFLAESPNFLNVIRSIHDLKENNKLIQLNFDDKFLGGHFTMDSFILDKFNENENNSRFKKHIVSTVKNILPTFKKFTLDNDPRGVKYDFYVDERFLKGASFINNQEMVQYYHLISKLFVSTEPLSAPWWSFYLQNKLNDSVRGIKSDKIKEILQLKDDIKPQQEFVNNAYICDKLVNLHEKKN